MQDNTYGYRDVTDPINKNEVNVTDFSGRENDSRVLVYDQEVHVLAPGSWVIGPFLGYPAYNHIPWWSPGKGSIRLPPNLVNFYYIGGTSMATPYVSGRSPDAGEKPNIDANGS